MSNWELVIECQKDGTFIGFVLKLNEFKIRDFIYEKIKRVIESIINQNKIHLLRKSLKTS